jgi:hypothetical protein
MDVPPPFWVVKLIFAFPPISVPLSIVTDNALEADSFRLFDAAIFRTFPVILEAEIVFVIVALDAETVFPLLMLYPLRFTLLIAG